MSSFSSSPSRRIAAAVSVLTVLAVTVGSLVLALGVSLPETWWPHTGQAFTANTAGRSGDRCERIAGPARAYCERGTTAAAPGRHRAGTSVWPLLPAGAGLAALVLWRHRGGSHVGRR
ncbi:hypothetical protein [Streptomyces spiralis]|uniref:hypothetical protein n=1 Tax=Streptomyces spiralis TaxID=66376 RepID=UPI0036B8E66D